MHPFDTAFPIDHGSSVPWMAIGPPCAQPVRTFEKAEIPTAPGPYGSSNREATSARISARVGRLAVTCSASTVRHISTHRGSVCPIPLFGPLALCTSPAGPDASNAATQRRSVGTAIPSSAALARYRAIIGVPGW